MDKENLLSFLSQYDEQVIDNVLQLRDIVLANLPNVIEQIDLPAKMVAYCYGNKYSELICTIIPSKKGVKLGFNRGTKIHDPNNLLKGVGKISRYVEIKNTKDIDKKALIDMVKDAYELYLSMI
ncbi:MAG: DUF1801 domain-containing protein [Bacteroidales bacterium]|jgi:hypothetical protein|nr:DUF1801 domain-containing protein [Bacteroidales bacterium]